MKTKQFFILTMMVALGSLVWTACQKNDMPVAKTEDDRAEEKFFNSHAAAKPAATAVLQYVQRRNSQLPFVKQMMQKAGIPRWDKALIFENVSLPAGRGAVLGDSTTVVHIPFVPENDSMVRGSLMVRMSPNDTTMNLISAQDYASYGFGNPTPGSWNAHDVFNILTKLDNIVFGRTTYRITDGRLMGDSQHVNYKVTIDHTPPDPTLAELFVTLTVTNSQTVCIIAGAPGSGPGVCHTYVYITTYFIEIPEGNGGGGGGGTGGGPTGGGGSGGTGGPIVTGWVDWDDDDEEVGKYADLEWDVYYIPQSSGGGAVLTTDRFYGRFRANHPENNRFTSGVHLNNRLVANSEANFVCGTWGVTVNSNTLATTVCGGNITYASGEVSSINKSKTVHISSLPWQ